MTHPKRAAGAQALADRLPELAPEVVLDPLPDGPPTALRAACAAWARADPAGTHHLVLQDDALPVPDFPARLRTLIEAAPDAALCLTTEWGSRSSHVIRMAALLGRTLAPVIDDYTPCVALVLPTEVALGFDAYVRAKTETGTPDDVALLNYLADRGVRTLVPVANLADHREDDSLVGNNVMGIRSAACLPAPQDVPEGSYTLLDGFDAVAYYDFWGQFADVCVPDASSTDGWQRTSARVWLQERGIGYGEILAALEEALGRLEQGALLRDRLSEVVLSQLWTVAFLTGVTAARTARRTGYPLDVSTPLAGAALSTFGPGALRRVVPAARLPELTEALVPLVTDAVRAGAAREHSLTAREAG
jgi:hypothetical protein